MGFKVSILLVSLLVVFSSGCVGNLSVTQRSINDLNDLRKDVNYNNPSNNDLWVWDSLMKKWTNKSPSVFLSNVNGYLNYFTDGDLNAGILTIDHDLNSYYPNLILYNDYNKVILPDEVVYLDVNTVSVDLSSYIPLTGTWKVRIAQEAFIMENALFIWDFNGLGDQRYSLLGHLHDDRYYTESEINSSLLNYLLKADLNTQINNSTILRQGMNVSSLVNDAGYLTSFNEVDPIVFERITNTFDGNWNRMFALHGSFDSNAVLDSRFMSINTHIPTESEIDLNALGIINGLDLNNSLDYLKTYSIDLNGYMTQFSIFQNPNQSQQNFQYKIPNLNQFLLVQL